MGTVTGWGQKIQIGDRVICKPEYTDSGYKFKGEATVIYIIGDRLHLKRDDGETGSGDRIEKYGNAWVFPVSKGDYLLVVKKHKTIMQKVSIMMKKLLEGTKVQEMNLMA